MDLVNRATQRQDEATAVYNSKLQREAQQQTLTEAPAFITGYSDGKYQVERLGQDPVNVGVPVTNGYLEVGRCTTTTGQFVDGVPRVRPGAPVTPTIAEIDFQFIFTAIGSDDQPYTFKCGNASKEISYANRQDTDAQGKGIIRSTGRTINRKLKLTFSGTIDGTLRTNVAFVFNNTVPQALRTTIGITATVTAAGATDRSDPSVPRFPSAMANYLILNRVTLTGQTYAAPLDARDNVDVASLPSTNATFNDPQGGFFVGDTIKGTLPSATIVSGNNGGFLLIYDSANNSLVQNSYYSYETTLTLNFA